MTLNIKREFAAALAAWMVPLVQMAATVLQLYSEPKHACLWWANCLHGSASYIMARAGERKKEKEESRERESARLGTNNKSIGHIETRKLGFLQIAIRDTRISFPPYIF